MFKASLTVTFCATFGVTEKSLEMSFVPLAFLQSLEKKTRFSLLSAAAPTYGN